MYAVINSLTNSMPATFCDHTNISKLKIRDVVDNNGRIKDRIKLDIDGHIYTLLDVLKNEIEYFINEERYHFSPLKNE